MFHTRGSRHESERKDPEAPLAPNRQAFLDMCQELGINCHVLDRRALENYLSDVAIKTIKGTSYQSLGPYDKLENTPYSWGKQENWRIAREMSREELDQTDLGQFLNSL